MKLTILTSTLAAAAFAASAATASPVPAGPGVLSAAISVSDGRVAGHLTLANHNRPGHRGPRRYGRFGRCEPWRRAHRKLHRRYDHVQLLRTVHNRRGARIFIAHARNYRGRPVRIRYNACQGRVMKVTPLRGRYYRGGNYRHNRYDRGWRR